MENRWFKWVVLGSFILGIGLVIISLFLPPTGVVDPSVINSVGMIFTFASIFEALLSNKVVKMTSKIGELYIGDKDGQIPKNDVADE